jgi:hypothetical protein
MRIKSALTISCLLVVFFGWSQVGFFVKDSTTNQALPFVKVFPTASAPFLTDMDGFFAVPDGVQQVKLHYMGYKDTVISLVDVLDNNLFMVPVFQAIPEVLIVAGENPAHRIMDQVIANRKQNHPFSKDAFRYESYTKFLIDINRDALEGIPENTTDTNQISLKKFFDQQHVFLLESTSKRLFFPPSREQEEITAYKVSGFTHPVFSTLAKELQSFSFYDNQVDLVGKNYINPIAFGGTKRYLFVLEDTLVRGVDTTFTIYYRPKTGKNFEGMTGRLYVNTNGYALEKVTAMPYGDSVGTQIQIVQEYVLLEGNKWFPAKLSTEIHFKSIEIDSSLKEAYLIGKGSTYLKNVQLNPSDLRKRDVGSTTLFTADGAGEMRTEYWDSVRPYQITQREEQTYIQMDSISKAEKLDKKLQFFTTFSEGKLPLGYVNLNLARLLNFTAYEGTRVGVGLETSNKLHKKAVLGAYVAYGTNDKTWKHGYYSTFIVNRKRAINTTFRYQQDVLERGGFPFQHAGLNFSTSSSYRQLFIQNMENQRLGEVLVSGYIRSNMKVSVIQNYQRVWTTDNYLFSDNSTFPTAPRSIFDIAETALEFTWNIREKVFLVGNTRVSRGTNFPRIKARIAKGWKGFADAELDYLRFQLDVQQDIPIIGIGKFSWNLTAGQTLGNVPLFLVQVANGTGRSWNVSVANSFETMLPATFYTTRQFSIFTRFAFAELATKAKWNAPQLVVHHAFGFGDYQPKSNHSVAFQTMDKGYFEAGLILNNLLVIGSTGFGIGTFYTYGAYAAANWKHNILPKFSLSLKF